MAEVGIRHILAASDWQTIAAIIVFTLISIVANWVKKRSEAANAPQRPDSEADEEFEPVELFEEPKPKYRPAPVARPTAPKVLIAGPRRPEPSVRPASERVHTTEAQVRISSILRTPRVPLASALGTSEKGRPPQKTIRSAMPQGDVVEVPHARGQEFLNLRSPRTLRQAVIAAELLRPPLALRGQSDLPGLA